MDRTNRPPRCKITAMSAHTLMCSPLLRPGCGPGRKRVLPLSSYRERRTVLHQPERGTANAPDQLGYGISPCRRGDVWRLAAGQREELGFGGLVKEPGAQVDRQLHPAAGVVLGDGRPPLDAVFRAEFA